MSLTDLQIRQTKPGNKPIKLSDGEGLQLVVSPAGGRSWKLAYRFNGKQRELTIGRYPEFGLAEARAERDRAKRQLATGRDPAMQKKLSKLAKAESNAATFSILAAELLDKKRREGKAATTLSKLEWLFSLAVGDLGERPVAEISAPEVLATLKKIERRGKLETAKRLRSVIGEVFRYAIATARASNDPTFALRGALTAPAVKHRAAITDIAGLGGLLRAIDDFQGQPTTIAALRLAAYLFPRPGELRQANWAEFDVAAAIWTIPASRAKMRRPHRIPLSSQAIAILQELRTITGHGVLVFPGYGMSGGKGRKIAPRPISENTLNSALRRMGYGPDQMTAHGFRAAASTLLNESGRFSADAIERALAHQDSDAVRRAYARGEFWDERVVMYQWWADRLDAWRENGKLTSMHAG